MTECTPSHSALDALIKETETLVSVKDRPILNRFLRLILTDLHCSPDDQPHKWQNKTVLANVFNFFQKPLGSPAEEIKIQVTSSDEEDETQILIHLTDTPFILDTLRNYLIKNGHTLHAQNRTTFPVHRDDKGGGVDILEEDKQGKIQGGTIRQEMVLLVLIGALPGKTAVQNMQKDLMGTLASVKQSVDDFGKMTQTIQQESDLLKQAGHLTESRFLLWIQDNHFVFMGTQCYRIKDGNLTLEVNGHNLGIFRGPAPHELLDRITPGLRQEIEVILHHTPTDPEEAWVSVEHCQNGHAIIYDSDGVDFFTIRRPSPKNDGWRILLVLGRFSRTALAVPTTTIPILDERLNKTLDLSGYSVGSYLRHEFSSLFDRMPLRELFHSSPEVLTEHMRRILKKQGDTDVSINHRLGVHKNYVAILITLSSNRYTAQLENRIADILSEHLETPITFIDTSGSGTLFFIVCYADHDPKIPFEFDTSQVQRKIEQLVMTWEDELRKYLLEASSQKQALALFIRYVNRFEPIYKEVTPPDQAAKDIAIIDTMIGSKIFASRLVRHKTNRTFIKLFSTELVELTQIIQTFDNFGITCLHELSSLVEHPNGALINIQRFEVGGSKESQENLNAQAARFLEALKALWEDKLLDDELNRLVLLEGLSHREMSLIQGLRQYQLQINPELSSTKINRVLLQHHALANLILRLFIARFDPDMKDRTTSCLQLVEQIEQGLTQVANLQDDQVLRGLANVVHAAVRTNYFQKPTAAAISFKIDCAAIDKMPKPRPWREIFIFGPHVEGIHLRGGKVARGGLRFSDRLEDYRTEVLGLMKTQMVKNAIIIPLGAKGGFIIPRLDQQPKHDQKAWVAQQYKVFIRSLLDITDNLVNGDVVHPDRCIRYDESDPYLVVAADKGTAAFSDLANDVAEKEYQFWLGDAFASGGSYGYDHKKLAITAKGAWECIALHFEELGRNIHSDPFTVVAIGDMAGDVFGNGMLASKQICLVGAFNHQHIFLDPDPDPAKSFVERERLFHLPNSSWTDYDQKLISQGGGIFLRTAKSIPLTPPLRRVLDTEAETLSGEEVIKALLKAKVDLLYNGGIGTYIKGSEESHQDVSDKSNDSVRINGSAVRALIIGEGGNLGITQKGRLEISRFPQRKEGGRVNTDALDNSGGVDLSDHEVNLKILLDHLVQNGEIKSTEERNTMLASLASEVTDDVLLNNRMQHQAVSRDMNNSILYGYQYLDILKLLQQKAGLVFEAEDIPELKELARWLADNRGLPRPLLAIMLGYAKLFLQKELLASEVVDMHFFEHHLTDYFPVSIGREFDSHLSNHFLKREIIATSITNRVINQTGVGHLFKVYNAVQETKAFENPIALLVKAYLIIEHLVDAPHFRQQIHALGHAIPTNIKYQALDEMERVILHLAKWMLFRLGEERISVDVINLYAKTVRAYHGSLWKSLPTLLSEERLKRLIEQRKELTDKGLPDTLATQTILLPFLRDIMTVLHIKESLHTLFEPVGHLYIRVDDFFGLSWIDENLKKVQTRDNWGRLNIENLRRELLETRIKLVEGIISFKRHNESVAEAFKNYLQEVHETNLRYQELICQLKTTEKPDHLPLSVLVRKLREFILQPL